MAEIKSTLDLVLERTRHLRLSEEEKQLQEIESAKKQTSGRIQRLKAKAMSASALKREWDEIKQNHHLSGQGILIEALLEALTLDQDNTEILAFLKSELGINPQPLADVISAFHASRQETVKKRTAEAKNELQKKFFLSGSAVIPNLEADPLLKKQTETLGQDYGQRLAEEKRKIVSAFPIGH